MSARLHFCCSADEGVGVILGSPVSENRFWCQWVLKNFISSYRKGTSIRQAPVFRHLRALQRNPWKFIMWMNEL